MTERQSAMWADWTLYCKVLNKIGHQPMQFQTYEYIVTIQNQI